MNLIEPFKTEIDFATGALSPKRNIIRRRLSDMNLMYADRDEAMRILSDEGDRLIYEVQGVELPDEEGQIPHCTTRILPGRVGDEYHMTKGHYHARREQGEVYFGLSGAVTCCCRRKAAQRARSRWSPAAPPTCRPSGRTARSTSAMRTSSSFRSGKRGPGTITARSSATASECWLSCGVVSRRWLLIPSMYRRVMSGRTI